MPTKNIRRRLHHGDIDGRRNEYVDPSNFDGNSEPFLENANYAIHYKGCNSKRKQDWEDKKEVNLRWTLVLSNLTVQWFGIVSSFANITITSGSVLGRLIPSSSTIIQQCQICLGPLQIYPAWPKREFFESRRTIIIEEEKQFFSLVEERLKTLSQRVKVQFDGSCPDHQNALKQLWQYAYPNREIPPLKSEFWKEMGWQGCDPSTDFRAGGYISLENLIFFAKNYPNSFQILLHKAQGMRAEWEYPFAVAGINISFMLIQMLDLKSELPSSKAGVRFLQFLADDEAAFDVLYCLAFCMLDGQWLAHRASYMEFNEVLKSTRTQLERELALENISSIKDLPAYSMLL